MIIPLGDMLKKTAPALEPLGTGLLQQSMGTAAKATFPDYDGGFMLGSTDTPISGIFHWPGVDWTPDIILKRFIFFGIAIGLTLLSSLFFDRFDPSRNIPTQKKSTTSPLQHKTVPVKQILSQPVHLTPLEASENSSDFLRVLISEIKLMFKSQRWWWYAVAIGLFVASLFIPVESVRAVVLPFAWIWPILIWSAMGNREIQNNTQQLVFSSAAPMMRQLPATWLAGFIVAIMTGGGAGLKLLGAGDTAGLLAWISGALFIPSLALAMGVWSKNNKVFEVLYVSVWYIGPMNKVHAVDYLGANSSGNIEFFFLFSIVLIVAAFIGRARQLNG